MRRTELKIAIDGPAGAGKSTVAKGVAKRLGLFYLDTGAMYRVLAHAAQINNIPIDQEKAIVDLAERIKIEMDHSEHAKVWCNGEDVSAAIRTPEVTRAVSTVAAYPEVRRRMVELQQHEGAKGGVVMDGRDIGTHVMPDAPLKVFLTASPEERARRRWEELHIQGKKLSLQDVARDMERRDRQDSGRLVAPLKPADDALMIDTTGRTIEDIINQIVKLAEERIRE